MPYSQNNIDCTFPRREIGAEIMRNVNETDSLQTTGFHGSLDKKKHTLLCVR